MSKELSFDKQSLEHLKNGINIIANAVKVTFGPQGRLVMYGHEKHSPTKVTKDGVTVANQIYVQNPYQDRVVQLIKQAANKTAQQAGDGTTTATILAQAIALEGLRNIANGANPVELKKGIEIAVKNVVQSIENLAAPIGSDINKIKHVACIAANNDEEIGTLIAQAIEKIGHEGVITIEQSQTVQTYMETVEGMEIQSGYISPLFVTNKEKMIAVLENPAILLCDSKIQSINELIPILSAHIQKPNPRPFIIIAQDVEGEALSSLIVNRVQKNLPFMCIKAPANGETQIEILKDIATLTAAQLISDNEGKTLQNSSQEMLGSAQKVIVTKDNTTIIAGKGNPKDIQQRITTLKYQLQNTTNQQEKENIRLRIAKLNSGVAILHVGAASEAEMNEKIDRIDDALKATKASIEEGITPGGGTTYIRACKDLNNLKIKNQDQKIGIEIIKHAIKQPLTQICSNANINHFNIINKIIKGKPNFGFNAKTNKYENLIDKGVIDPAKVCRVALQNAASVAIQIILTEVIIVNREFNT